MGADIKTYVARVKQLLCLEQAVRYGSISKAADENYMKQPNLSQQITSLEKSIQKKVIDRHSKGISLTECGYQYYLAACDLKNILTNTENFSPLSERMLGNIRLWTTDGLASIYLAKCFCDFYQKYPQVNLDINCSIKMPKLHEFDMGLVFQKPTVKSLVVVGEQTLHFSLYASKEYLKKKGMPKNLADLRMNHHICSNHSYTTGWKEWSIICKNSSHQTNIENSSVMLLHLIKSGIGIGLLPRIVPQTEKNLVELKNLVPDFAATFYLVVKQGSFQNPKIKALTDIIGHETLK